MKIRTDFVTNSSSSSYMCVAKVDMCDELKEYMREEFGRFGTNLLEKNVIKGSDINLDSGSEIADFFSDRPELFDEDSWYLAAFFIEWTNDGDTEGADAFLYRSIPEKYAQEIYDGGR